VVVLVQDSPKLYGLDVIVLIFESMDGKVT
jgi:hypothetical protein